MHALQLPVMKRTVALPLLLIVVKAGLDVAEVG